MTKFTPPEYKLAAFSCPYCDAYSSMSWSYMNIGYNGLTQTGFIHASCSHCDEASIWNKASEAMIYPHKKK